MGITERRLFDVGKNFNESARLGFSVGTTSFVGGYSTALKTSMNLRYRLSGRDSNNESLYVFALS
jgi:hypothetical protein